SVCKICFDFGCQVFVLIFYFTNNKTEDLLIVEIKIFLYIRSKMSSESRSIYIRTPLIESVPLRQYSAGRKIYLKLENCQPSGSCKLRGIAPQVEYVSFLNLF